MKYFMLAIMLTLVANVAKAQDLPSMIVGTWRSDEAKTLADMHKHPDVTEKSRKLFENHFFGRLVNSIEKNRFASYFIEDQDKPLKYEPYKITEVGADYLKIQDGSSETGTLQESQWFFEGDCIYTYVTKWHFREYFCRIR